VPRRFFRRSAPNTSRPAVFIGSAYQRRAKYLHNDRLKQGLLEFRASGEHATELPKMFDQLNNPVRQAMLEQPCRQADMERFVDTMQQVRAKLFDLFLDGLSDSLATVNLTSFVKTYAGRVVESMAIGQPVVSWRIPSHPQTARMFRENEHILFFENDDPDSLADTLERLKREPGLAERIGERCLANAKNHHTSEHRVAQILEWTRTGIAPRFWD
jgi:glycosyltransferase involved in cell wall biosynthesis